MTTIDEILHATFTTDQRKALAKTGEAMPGGRFPIRNASDLANAIQAVGRASGGEEGRDAVRRHIIKRAKALGLSDKIPDTWNADGTLKHSDIDEALEHYGVKGQKWGIRRPVNSSTGLVTTSDHTVKVNRRTGDIRVKGGTRSERKALETHLKTGGTIDGKTLEEFHREANLRPRASSADQIRVDRIATKLNKGGVDALSNKDLRDFTERVRLEKEFNSATTSSAAVKGDSFAKRYLKQQGQRQFTRVADKAVDLAVETALSNLGIRVKKKNTGVGEALEEISTRIKPKQKKKGPTP